MAIMKPVKFRKKGNNTGAWVEGFFGADPSDPLNGFTVNCSFCKGIYCTKRELELFYIKDWKCCPSCSATASMDSLKELRKDVQAQAQITPAQHKKTKCKDCQKEFNASDLIVGLCPACLLAKRIARVTAPTWFGSIRGSRLDTVFQDDIITSKVPVSNWKAPKEFWFSYNGTWYQASRFIPNSFTVICPICDTKLELLVNPKCKCGAEFIREEKLEKEFEDMARYRNSYSYPKKLKASALWDAQLKVYKFHIDGYGDKDFTDIIKQYIPSHERSYDPSTKTWLFLEEAWEALKDIAAVRFEMTTMDKKIVEEKWKEFNTGNIGTKVIDTDSEFLKFQKYLKAAGFDFDITKQDDKDYVRKIYRRALLSYYHPDKFPERATQCSEFNSTFQNLQKFFGLEKEQEQLA